jgi:hypothetical protein
MKIAEPTTLPNPEVEALNPNQLALVGFSRYLETKSAALAEKQSPAAAKAMTLEIGKRLLWSTEQDRHGEVAAQRVEQFLELARQTESERLLRGRAKTDKERSALAKGMAAKAANARKAIKKPERVPARPTPIGKVKSASAKKAAKSIAKKAAKAPPIKRKMVTPKKSEKKTRRGR